MRIEVLAHAGHVADALDELLVVRIVVDEVDLRGVDDQQRRIVVEMEKTCVGIDQSCQIVVRDVLL